MTMKQSRAEQQPAGADDETWSEYDIPQYVQYNRQYGHALHTMPHTMPGKSPVHIRAQHQLLAQLGARMRLARLRRRLTATAMAKCAGISRTTLYSAESGGAAVTMGTYLRILAVLELERDIATLAADDVIGRRLQDERLDPRRKAVRAAHPSPAPGVADGVAENRTAAARGRPRSLAQVARWGQALGDTDAYLREFLDEFYVARGKRARTAMLATEPALAADDRTNAYLGAVGEHLAMRNGLPVPPWTAGAPRFLKRPYFPAGLESLKATLLVESPTAFRRRLIFVGADPLFRPRKDTVGVGQ